MKFERLLRATDTFAIEVVVIFVLSMGENGKPIWLCIGKKNGNCSSRVVMVIIIIITTTTTTTPKDSFGSNQSVQWSEFTSFNRRWQKHLYPSAVANDNCKTFAFASSSSVCIIIII